MTCIQQLIELDKELLLAINGANSPFFDNFFYLVSGKWMWLPTALAILFVIIKTKHRQSIWIILAMVLTIVLADQISSSLIKPLVERLRPTHEPSLVGMLHIVQGYTGGQYGFVSSHAANAFAFALFSTLLFKNRVYAALIFFGACLSSYSRMYLGVHYPLDIAGGICVGCFSAVIAYEFLKKIKPEVLHQTKNAYKTKDIYIIAAVWIISVAVIALFNNQLLFLA